MRGILPGRGRHGDESWRPRAQQSDPETCLEKAAGFPFLVVPPGGPIRSEWNRNILGRPESFSTRGLWIRLALLYSLEGRDTSATVTWKIYLPLQVVGLRDGTLHRWLWKPLLLLSLSTRRTAVRRRPTSLRVKLSHWHFYKRVPQLCDMLQRDPLHRNDICCCSGPERDCLYPEERWMMVRETFSRSTHRLLCMDHFEHLHESIRSLNLAGIFTCTVPGLGPLFRRRLWGRVDLTRGSSSRRCTTSSGI